MFEIIGNIFKLRFLHLLMDAQVHDENKRRSLHDVVRDEVEEIDAAERVVFKYAFPSEIYEEDNGLVAYIALSFVEIPFKVFQVGKNLYYHTRGLEHRHESSREHFSAIGDF